MWIWKFFHGKSFNPRCIFHNAVTQNQQKKFFFKKFHSNLIVEKYFPFYIHIIIYFISSIVSHQENHILLYTHIICSSTLLNIIKRKYNNITKIVYICYSHWRWRKTYCLRMKFVISILKLELRNIKFY